MNNETDKWQLLHGRFIHSFLLLLNKQTDQFVLKGGTALSICYGLNRFSEDIDLDGRKQDIKEIVRRFSTQHNIKFRIAKDTPTVKRCLMDYGNPLHPLKIEVSYRNRDLDISEAAKDWTKINGINVYTIDALARMKAMAYQGRDKIRDLYDLSFICNNYYEKLSYPTRATIRDTLSYKGIEQFDYLVATQNDPLIDKDKLADGFLKMHEKLGLLMDQFSEKKKQDNERSR
ncbi:nucleotidyl transferase AbiEii/AbiGii toxin family protein [uncultured Parasutterella sp.]|uniref:nucleotidyl transferase AbiEii/AbiGii toxin family protein n=1 Tax=uncultured Parasutterella sp. TaxID=1263098 RepID=UPI002597C74F|nr:nucleotidyl transferase AbiEii/AbiGii toxin family protein [uncultured Parasutterella sp.]